MIQKIIHYCWFGGNPLPPLAKRCIKSWKKYCKGYEIREWNENTFDIASAPLYVRQAYEAKKWAFVSDYVRLYAMTLHGGIYMDTDVEVVKSLDGFLHHAAFSGFESETDIPTGIMACEKGFPLFVEFLRHYDDARFVNPDGSLNTQTNVVVMTKICLEHGLQKNNRYQVIDGFALYPKDVFCPLDYQSGQMCKSRDTATIHWFNGSWMPEEIREIRKKRRKAAKIRDMRYNLRYLPNRIVCKILGKDHYEKLKRFLTKK